MQSTKGLLGLSRKVSQHINFKSSIINIEPPIRLARARLASDEGIGSRRLSTTSIFASSLSCSTSASRAPPAPPSSFSFSFSFSFPELFEGLEVALLLSPALSLGCLDFFWAGGPRPLFFGGALSSSDTISAASKDLFYCLNFKVRQKKNEERQGRGTKSWLA